MDIVIFWKFQIFTSLFTSDFIEKIKHINKYKWTTQCELFLVLWYVKIKWI